jgi:peroxiredoxin (alkyl hydroperoxide reductase subunit C)
LAPEEKMTVRIGMKAPDFKAEAYYRGTIQEIQLSHYQGQWVVLLFYPADFTFV